MRSRLNVESEWDPDAVAFFGRPDILSGLFTLASDDALARALYESGDPDKARKTYEKITVLTIRRLADRDLYAKAFYRLGKIAEQQGG